jgi:acetyl-CoA carboxylase biotin carboxyl carrier protein
VLDLVAGTDVIELEVSTGTARLSLWRQPVLALTAPSAADGQVTQETPLPAGAPLAIASPLVGIFHPSVKPGDSVQQGQAIGAIEALGMPTSVDAPQSGTVGDLLALDGTPVEYGQPLIVLRR